MNTWWRPALIRVWMVLAVVAFLGLTSVAQRATAADDRPVSGERLVTIYDNGVEQTIITKAATVEAALEQAGIHLESADTVEPGLTTELVAKNYRLNVYRARPVLIVDGEKRTSVMTAEQSPRQIMADAGGTLYDEDAAEFGRVDSVVSDGGAGLRLIIDRATTFQFSLYGKTFEARSQAATVGAMLAEKQVTLGPEDGTSVPVDTPLVAGMNVAVWRNGKQTVTVEEAIAKPVEEVKDTEREVGFREVKTPGADGKKQVTYEIEMRDGVEVGRHVITSVTTLEPVKEVITVGAKSLLGRAYSAEKEQIMAAAGVSPSDYSYAAYIIDHENASWCPTRWQGQVHCPETYAEKFAGAESSAQVGYGLCQSTPAIKMATAGADWRTNPVTQMKWCASYAQGRYGSWAAAYRFKVANGWW